jgi:hypothetical protein
MRELVFTGEVRSNKGQFSDMEIPGRGQLEQAPDDWPTQLCRGSFNVGISDGGFPDGFDELGEGEGVQKLDRGSFAPEFLIPHNRIRNNSLKPRKGMPLRGHAQVWRATIELPGRQPPLACWMLRRIGSTIKRQIELVSDTHLKTTLDTDDGQTVVVRVFAGVAGKSQ